MDAQQIVYSQYLAALEMLKGAVVKCPYDMWDDADHKNRFWHVAYHALFYTHLYVSASGEEFSVWSKHREEYEFMGPLPWPPHKEPEIGEPFTKEEVLEYYEFVRQRVQDTLPALNLEADASGFSWLPMGKLELQFYNIRHLQQHTGELCERLGTEEGISVDWVGMGEALA
jgi:hypothetical protein